MAHESIRARQIVESPLSSLQIGSHHTTSSAIQKLRFVGTLVEWPDFFQKVENANNQQPWSRLSRQPPRTFGRHTVEPERVRVGDEHGLQGRFQQAIGHELGEALQFRGTDLYFADFKCSGSTYENIPDVVGLRYDHGATEIKLVGELKAPWINDHDLPGALSYEKSLRRKIAQPLRDMKNLNCEYGFISTYEETIFLRQFRPRGGAWEVWYSQSVSSSTYYVPTDPNAPLALPKVSMKMCMFYVCDQARMSRPAHNLTRN